MVVDGAHERVLAHELEEQVLSGAAVSTGVVGGVGVTDVLTKEPAVDQAETSEVV